MMIAASARQQSPQPEHYPADDANDIEPRLQQQGTVQVAVIAGC